MPVSMGAHESQSLFWEHHVALSNPFLEIRSASTEK
jgi:Zn-dependent M32 family carboxypeptidase